MSRTRHHHAQRYLRRIREIWSRRCRTVTGWAHGRFTTRETHRFERRAARQEITLQRQEIGR